MLCIIIVLILYYTVGGLLGATSTSVDRHLVIDTDLLVSGGYTNTAPSAPVYDATGKMIPVQATPITAVPVSYNNQQPAGQQNMQYKA